MLYWELKVEAHFRKYNEFNIQCARSGGQPQSNFTPEMVPPGAGQREFAARLSGLILLLQGLEGL